MYVSIYVCIYTHAAKIPPKGSVRLMAVVVVTVVKVVIVAVVFKVVDGSDVIGWGEGGDYQWWCFQIIDGSIINVALSAVAV